MRKSFLKFVSLLAVVAASLFGPIAFAQEPSESDLTQGQVAQRDLTDKDFFLHVCAWIYYKYQNRSFIQPGWRALWTNNLASLTDEKHQALNLLQTMMRGLNDPLLELYAGAPQAGRCGIEFDSSGPGRFVVRVVGRDSPAARAGIRPGDTLVTSSGYLPDCQTVSQLNLALSGLPGSKLKLRLSRNEAPLEFDLIVTDKDPEPLSYCTILNSNIAYIKPALPLNPAKLAHFKQSLSELSKTKARSLILDLRNNLSDFSDPSQLCGPFVGDRQAFGINFRMSTEYLNGVNPQITSLPLIALVNSTTNTAAEVLAACLKQSRRGTLLGNQTAGKARIVTLEKVDRNRSLLLPTAEYVNCDGMFIEGNGIKPDIEVYVSAQDVEAGPWWTCSKDGNAPDILDGRDVQLKRALKEVEAY